MSLYLECKKSNTLGIVSEKQNKYKVEINLCFY